MCPNHISQCDTIGAFTVGGKVILQSCYVIGRPMRPQHVSAIRQPLMATSPQVCDGVRSRFLGVSGVHRRFRRGFRRTPAPSEAASYRRPLAAQPRVPPVCHYGIPLRIATVTAQSVPRPHDADSVTIHGQFMPGSRRVLDSPRLAISQEYPRVFSQRTWRTTTASPNLDCAAGLYPAFRPVHW